MANESAKGSKAGRVRKSQGHIRYNQNDQARRNRCKREIKNLKNHPDDVACFNRIKDQINGGAGSIPTGAHVDMEKAYQRYIDSHGANAS